MSARNIDSPLSVKVIDSLQRYGLPRPNRIAGKPITKIPAKNSPYKTIHCRTCFLPTVWFDKRINNQFNTCTNCGTHHQMRLDNWGHVKKRVVDRIPIGYNKGPFAIQKADTRETNDFG